jgi:hypothetical protein
MPAEPLVTAISTTVGITQARRRTIAPAPADTKTGRERHAGSSWWKTGLPPAETVLIKE